MKHPLLTLATVLCLSMPTLAAAQALECPEPAPVFSAADATPLDLNQLAHTVGTTELDGQSLKAVAEQIRKDYPEARNADVADILITAFCTYLNDDAPADHRSEANVIAFEKEAYGAAFSGDAPKTYTRQGWLFNN